MSEISERYGRIAAGFSARVDGVAPDGWSAPSPCTDWAARDVVAHVVDNHRRALAALDGTEATALDPAQAPTEWPAAHSAVRRALADDTRAATVIRGPFGEQPFEALAGGLLCADTLIHTWDLARATGQDDRLDADGVARATEFLAPLGDAIRRPGGFGTELPTAADDDPQTKLLHFVGRAV